MSASRRLAQVADQARSLPPHDAAHLLPELSPTELATLLSMLGDEKVAELVGELEPREAAHLLLGLSRAQAADILEEMPPDEATDVVEELSPEQAVGILGEMEQEQAEDVRQLLRYDPDTAGGIMTPEFLALPPDLTAQEAMLTIRRRAEEAETIYYAYVTDHQQRLVGVLSLRDLVLAPPSKRVSDLMLRDMVKVTTDSPQDEVARLFRDYHLLALPVVDAANRLQGIVTVDDVTGILQEDVAEDFLKAGAIGGGDETVTTPVRQAVRGRLPWMVANLFLYAVPAGAVALFEETIKAVAVLAVFMPIISTMGGNSGIQALNVAIRSIALGEIRLEEFRRAAGKELKVGLINGAVYGLLIGLVALAWKRHVALGLLAAFAMWFNCLWAAVLGGTMPFVLKRLGLDPAMMTGPILTTVTDLTGFTLFLGLATLFLAYL
ncbi:MAG: magnesium transporter [Chloroflexi bacterium]|nr:magnesium transporter [Chloroflexota bacterium]